MFKQFSPSLSSVGGGGEGLMGGLTCMITFSKKIQEWEFKKHLGHPPLFSFCVECVS